MERIDVEVENHGTVFLFRPLTPRGFEWIEDNVQAESWQWFGNALTVDHRYAVDLATGMQSAGLEVR